MIRNLWNHISRQFRTILTRRGGSNSEHEESFKVLEESKHTLLTHHSQPWTFIRPNSQQETWLCLQIWKKFPIVLVLKLPSGEGNLLSNLFLLLWHQTISIYKSLVLFCTSHPDAAAGGPSLPPAQSSKMSSGHNCMLMFIFLCIAPSIPGQAPSGVWVTKRIHISIINACMHIQENSNAWISILTILGSFSFCFLGMEE